MAIFMTVREEYEDALWRGKDVVACLPESVILLFAFFSQHDGAVIDVLAGDMYLVTGNCCTYTLKEEKKIAGFGCSIYASVFYGFEDFVGTKLRRRQRQKGFTVYF